ncbi:MAG: DUF308 domain-containing protein [Clostridia bacterium]
MLKKISTNTLILSIILIAAGVLFCIFQGEFVQWILIGAGALLILQGVLDLIHKITTFGIIEVAGGIITILCGAIILNVALIILGVALAVAGILFIVKGARKGRQLFNAISEIILGLLLVFAQSFAINWIFIIIGVFAIIYGLLLLFYKRA